MSLFLKNMINHGNKCFWKKKDYKNRQGYVLIIEYERHVDI